MKLVLLFAVAVALTACGHKAPATAQFAISDVVDAVQSFPISIEKHDQYIPLTQTLPVVYGKKTYWRATTSDGQGLTYVWIARRNPSGVFHGAYSGAEGHRVQTISADGPDAVSAIANLTAKLKEQIVIK